MRRSGLLATVPLVLALASTAPAQEPPLVPLPWAGYDPAAPHDRGRGVLAFNTEAAPVGRVDTVTVLAAPEPGAPRVALFLQEFGSETAPYQVASTPGLSANLVEFEYEVAGLPVDSAAPDGRWVRVVHAFDGERRPRFGWVAMDPARLRLVMWPEILREREVFLLEGTPWAFADAPGGAPRPIPPPSPANDYGLHPLQARGDWLEVRVVIPSDVCVDPDPAARTTVAWIRYLDPRGRPLVWFSSRGC